MTKRAVDPKAALAKALTPSKYHARRTEVDGITFASNKEATRYRVLRLLEKAGRIAQLELQVPYDLIVNGVKLGKYVADFRYWEGNEEAAILVIEDTKGFKTPVYQLKRKLMKALYDIDIVET